MHFVGFYYRNLCYNYVLISTALHILNPISNFLLFI